MNKLTHADFLERFKEKREDSHEYTFLTEYMNTKTKIKVKHTCGYEYEVTPNHLLGGRKCPNCGGGGIRNKTTEIFKREVKELVGDEYTVLGKYTGVKEKILFQHNLENGTHTFEMRPGDFLAGQRCPSCGKKEAGRKKTKDTETILNEINKIGNGEYELLSEYINSKEYITLRHSCGHEYNVSPVNFLKGHGCPKCALISSSGENELLEYVKSIYDKKIIKNDRKLLNGKEIDIYLPDSNIAFEYDGLYWHSEFNGKGKDYHKEKTLELKNQGIQLIHIFEDEWLYKKDLTKLKIMHILNMNHSQKIYGRKTIVKEINSELKNEFLEKYHIQGKDNSSIRLGLYSEEKLVAVMTFGKMRVSLGNKNSSENNYELIRYATDNNYIVIGGFGKLLSHFKSNYTYEKIRTYADLRWSSYDSNVYEKNNFKLIHESEPNYWYFNSNKLIRYHRYGYRKDVIKKKYPEVYDKNKTEYEMMRELNYYRIWDCGNLVYEMTKEKD